MNISFIYIHKYMRERDRERDPYIWGIDLWFAIPWTRGFG